MHLTRRELIVLAGATAITGCAHTGEEGVTRGIRAAAPVDAGPLADFAVDGAYGRFASPHRFFVIRQGPRIFAQSATCTHRNCLLRTNADGFYCKCHGSTFTLGGHVTEGPARRDLPRFAVERSSEDHLIVHLEQPPLMPGSFDVPQAFVSIM